jgi:hypothetical protein
MMPIDETLQLRENLMKTLTQVALLSSLYVLGQSVAVYGISLSFVPAFSSNPSQEVNINIKIEGLGDKSSPSLSSYDFDVAFDPTILDFQSFTFGDPILGNQLNLSGFGDLTDYIDNGSFVNISQTSFDLPEELNSLQAGDFTLGTLTFKPLQSGYSPLSFSNAEFLDENNPPQALDVTLQSGGIQVPEGSNNLGLMILLGAGCFLAVRSSRRN